MGKTSLNTMAECTKHVQESLPEDIAVLVDIITALFAVFPPFFLLPFFFFLFLSSFFFLEKMTRRRNSEQKKKQEVIFSAIESINTDVSKMTELEFRITIINTSHS